MMQIKISRTDARKNEVGFTLIEVMIAIVVMSVGILAVIASFATAVAATQSAEYAIAICLKIAAYWLRGISTRLAGRDRLQLPWRRL